jgi:arylsulfatase A-like enzyme
MIRKYFSLPFALVMLTFSCVDSAVCSAALPGNSENTRYPNIVIILADDLGYGDVQIYNPEGRIATPRIDDLALQGIRFTDAHSGAAVCSPTRYGLLTGQHFLRQPWERIRQQLNSSMIDEDRLTLPEMLQQQGYHTGAFGKWHLGQTFYRADGTPAQMPGQGVDWTRPASGGPNDRGFDTYFGVAFGQAHWLYALMSDRLVTEIPTLFSKLYPAKSAGYSPEIATPAITQKVLDYIDWNASERPGQPFFVYFALPAIHTPLVPSAEFSGKSDIGLYGDFVMQVDAAVGSVVDRLARHGVDGNTLVIFASDNGSDGVTGNHPKKHPSGSVYQRYGHKMNGSWRGIKGELYEGGHRVPFIARWPGVIKPGAVSDQLLTLEDLMATIATIVDVELPRGSAEDSYNLLSYFDGSHVGPPIRQYAVLSTFDGDAIVKVGDWVLSFQMGSGRNPKGRGHSHPFPYLEGSYTDPSIQQHAIFRIFDKGPVAQPGAWLQRLQLERTQAVPVREPAMQAAVAQGQLYNLGEDPQQLANVWLDYPEVVREMTLLYATHVARGSSFYIDR